MDSGQHQQRANQLYRRLLSDIGDYPHWKLSDVLTLIRHGVSEASLEAEWRTMFKIYIDQFTTLERADNLHKSIVDDYGKRDDNHDQMIERANELRERLKKHFGSDFKVTDERLMEYFRLKMPDEAIVRHYWWKVAQSLQMFSAGFATTSFEMLPHKRRRIEYIPYSNFQKPDLLQRTSRDGGELAIPTMTDRPPNNDTPSPNRVTRTREQDEDLWIELYYGILLAVSSLPSKPVVLQNFVQAHEQFSKFFPSSNINLSLFRSLCYNKATMMMMRLGGQLFPRIQQGGYPKALVEPISVKHLDMYRTVREQIGYDVDKIDPEKHADLWRLLSRLADELVQILDADAELDDDTQAKDAVHDNPGEDLSLRHSYAPGRPHASVANRSRNALTAFTAPTGFTVPPSTALSGRRPHPGYTPFAGLKSLSGSPAPLTSTAIPTSTAPTASTAPPKKRAGGGRSSERTWTPAEIAYLELYFTSMRRYARQPGIGDAKMPDRRQIRDDFNEFLRARDPSYGVRNVGSVNRYCGRENGPIYKLREAAKAVVKENGKVYVPSFTIAEFDQYLASR